MTAIIVVGLPGSGKSWLLDQFEAQGFFIFDDFTRKKEFLLDAALSLASQREKDIVISDPCLCDEKQLTKLLAMLSPLPYITCVMYFENDPEKCYNNVEYRADGRIVKNYIKQLSKIYIPKHPVMKIWQPND